MAPAIRRAFNGDRNDDRLDRVFGPAPRTGIAAAIAGGLAAGLLLERAPVAAGVAEYVSLPAVVIGAVYALLFRRYLFGGRRRSEDDFAWLAASLVPAVAVLALAALTGRIFGGELQVISGAPAWTEFGGLARAAADSLAVVAGLTIAVATLCFSRDWKRALVDLAVRLLAFKITIFVMVLVLVEIGLVGPLLAVVLDVLFGLRFPPWLGDFVDQLAYAALMSVVYLAVIGATWTACRRQFGQLLASGESDVLSEIASLARSGSNRATAGTTRQPPPDEPGAPSP